MAVTEAMLKHLRITSTVVFNKLLRHGWIDGTGRVKRWFDHQQSDHDEKIYSEPRTPRVRRQPFHKKDK